MKPFLMVFDPAFGPRQEILDYLNTRPEVLNWYAVLPGAIVIISEHNAFKLSELLRARFVNRYFIVSEISGTTSDGFINKEVWDFLNYPKSSGRWK